MRTLTVLLGVLALSIAGCSDEKPQAPVVDPTITTAMIDPVVTAPELTTTRVAILAGDNEVPPRETLGRGIAWFHISADQTEIAYRLNVANIQNVTQAHIHAGPAGANGSVVTFLYGLVVPSGPIRGTIATGTITAANLIGPLAGQPLSALIALFENEGAYVNVHTSQFPGGEIRGQIGVPTQ